MKMLMALNTQWTAWAERFAELQRRERVLLGAMAVALVIFPVYTWLLEPLVEQRARGERQLEQQQKSYRETVQTIEQLNARLQGDNGQKTAERELAELQRLQQQFALQLREQTIDLIPADRMSDVLERLLASARGIKLLQLRSLAPLPLLDLSEQNSQVGNLYQHGIELTFSGRYFDVLKFLEDAEQLPWRFYWETLDYQVQKFPRGEVKVVLYTLSTSDKFIGVGK